MMNRYLLSLFLLTNLITAGFSTENWSEFRGPNHSGLGTVALPTIWSDTENLAWKTTLPGKGSSSPIAVDDTLFVTAYSGYGTSIEAPGDREELKLHVICLGVADGSIRWTRTIKASENEQKVTPRVADHGYASPTACADQENVYSYFGPSGLVAFGHDGKLKWRTLLGSNTAGFGAASSPILYDDLVIMNASIEDNAIYGIDKISGEIRWKTEGIERAWTTPTIVRLNNGNRELIINQKGAIQGLDPKTGKQLWSCDGIQDYVVPSVIAKGETLYCSGGRSNMTFAVKAGGRGDVSETHLLWDATLGANVTSPILINDLLFWSHDKALALCVRASDGQEVFRKRLPTRSRIYASIVSDGSKLFLTTRDAGVLVLAAESDYKELAINRCGGEDEKFNATPAIIGNRLILRSDQAIYCIQNKSGNQGIKP